VFQGEIRLELSTLGNGDTICCLRSILKYIYYILLVIRGDAVIVNRGCSLKLTRDKIFR
jgi:hypothetical protein